MPNWCKNILRIEGDNLEVKRCIKMLKDDKGHLTFNKIAPMRLPLEDTTSPVPESVSDEERKRLIDRYGADNWFDWRYKNWGVKWDASEDNWEDEQVDFETPWGPPIKFFEKATREFPSLKFKLQFSEENMGYFPLGEATITKNITNVDGPKEGSKQAEKFADNVWLGIWVDNWKEL